MLQLWTFKVQNTSWKIEHGIFKIYPNQLPIRKTKHFNTSRAKKKGTPKKKITWTCPIKPAIANIPWKWHSSCLYTVCVLGAWVFGTPVHWRPEWGVRIREYLMCTRYVSLTCWYVAFFCLFELKYVDLWRKICVLLFSDVNTVRIFFVCLSYLPI